MAKLKSVYVCTECGETSAKWMGACAGCGGFNTLMEDVIQVLGKADAKQAKELAGSLTVRKLSGLSHLEVIRQKTNVFEVDRVLGGGFVPGSLTLLAGEPGIGKSTLMLKIVDKFKDFGRILYVAGEEAPEQIAIRAQRMGAELANVEFAMPNFFEEVVGFLEREPVDFVVIDSVSVMQSAEVSSLPGSITQVRAVTDLLLKVCKERLITAVLIGHVNKEGNIAGPRVLEHMVDTVLQFEGDRSDEVRLLRALKNRFGSTDEVGLLAMTETGIEEVINPAKQLLAGRNQNVIGSALTVTIDGRRPFVVEVQALVNKSYNPYPKRSSNGFDLNRLNMLIAVLEKYHGLKLNECDVYVNVVGGVKIKEPGCDLAIIEAIKSSYQKIPLPPQEVYLGEVGLDGKVRDPKLLKLRLKEVRR